MCKNVLNKRTVNFISLLWSSPGVRGVTEGSLQFRRNPLSKGFRAEVVPLPLPRAIFTHGQVLGPEQDAGRTAFFKLHRGVGSRRTLTPVLQQRARSDRTHLRKHLLHHLTREMRECFTPSSLHTL